MLCLWRFHIFGSKGVLSPTRGRCRRHVRCHKGLTCKTSHFPEKWRKQNKSMVNLSRVWSWRQMLNTRKREIRSRRCFSERDQVWCFDEQIIQHFYSVTKKDSRFIKLKVKADFGRWPDTKIRNLSNSKHHQEEVLFFLQRSRMDWGRWQTRGDLEAAMDLPLNQKTSDWIMWPLNKTQGFVLHRFIPPFPHPTFEL